MGTIRRLFVLPLALVILYINYGSAYAQDMGMNTTSSELKVTTVSDAALQKYIDARGAMENMQMDKAYGLFADAIRLDPDFALAYVFSAVTAGDFPARVKNIDKAVALKDKVTPGETYLIGYYKAMLEGNYPVQQECITKLSDMYPKDKRVLTYTGMHWYSTSNYDKAINSLDKAVIIDPNFAPAYNMLGYSYMKTNDYSNAETSFEKYISLMPNSPNPHDSYAELLLTEGKYDQSIDQYKKALAIDPTFTSSLKGIGDNYCLKGDYAVAREYYQKLYDTAPDVYSKESALYGISVSYVREGKTDMALTTLDKRVALAEKNDDVPTAVSSLNSKGFILAENGRAAEAVTQFQTALRKVKSSSLPVETVNNMKLSSRLNIAYAQILQNQLDEPSQTIDNIGMEITGTNPRLTQQYNFVAGILALKQNKASKAVELLGKADTENPLVWRYSSIAYTKAGNTDMAAKIKSKIDTFTQNDLPAALAATNSQDIAEIFGE